MSSPHRGPWCPPSENRGRWGSLCSSGAKLCQPPNNQR